MYIINYDSQAATRVVGGAVVTANWNNIFARFYVNFTDNSQINAPCITLHS